MLISQPILPSTAEIDVCNLGKIGIIIIDLTWFDYHTEISNRIIITSTVLNGLLDNFDDEDENSS